ncbi:C40 family peptidase [Streptomyces yerevanensis]|uniref:C40 family peptidase n=1 Tax=Streptomyces yerevanensis TaxID=66378 RepID=UPI000525DCEF|nr:C40 family peptidase [Streptomyces yerevanensis]
MSGRFLRLVCTAAIAAGAALSPAPTAAVAEPGDPGERPVAELLTDLQRLYRETGQATETYNATEEKLTDQRAEVAKLNRRLARARLSLHDSRSAAARLARQQYQSSTEISPYVRLLLARDPQHALDQGHVIRQLSKRRAATVNRLIGSEKKTDALARAARKALDGQLALAERQKKDRDAVQQRLEDVEELLTSLSADQLAELAELEKVEVAEAQEELVASGALDSSVRPPSRQGEAALRYAVEQIGKPYEWGAEGPDTYDCSGLTSEAWGHAGQPTPRTSQEQWDRLPRIPLSELRPGDLVVYFPEATHVALYLGDGMVIHAPRPDTTVKVSPLAANPVLGAVRPDPAGEPLRQYTPPKLPPGATDGSDEGYEGES